MFLWKGNLQVLLVQIEMPKVKSEPRVKSEPQSQYLSSDQSNNNDDIVFDPNERQHVFLGRGRYVYCSRFQGVKSLHIRRMRDKRGKLYFTKEGVNLTREEWFGIYQKKTTFESFLVSKNSFFVKS